MRHQHLRWCGQREGHGYRQYAWRRHLVLTLLRKRENRCGVLIIIRFVQPFDARLQAGLNDGSVLPVRCVRF